MSRLPSSTKTSSYDKPVACSVTVRRSWSADRFSSSLNSGTTTDTSTVLICLVEHLARPPAARSVELHFEQIDQRAAAREHAIAFEQRLVLEHVKIEVLSERVDEIFVGN